MQKNIANIVYPVNVMTKAKKHILSLWPGIFFLSTVLCMLSIPTFCGLWKLWNSDKNFEGLMLVPCMFALILFKSKDELFSVEGKSIRMLLYIFPVTSSIMLIFSMNGYIRPAGLLFVINTAILFFTVYGFKAKKLLSGPLLFLMLMVPLPHNTIDFLTVNLQRFFSFVMEMLLSVLSISFLRRDGFVFWFEGLDNPMIVTDQCSGFSSLWGFVIISLFFAVIGRYKLPKTLMLLITGIIIALALNLARIMITVKLRLCAPGDYSVGRWHSLLGMAVFLIGCVVLSSLSKFLKPVCLAGKKEQM